MFLLKGGRRGAKVAVYSFSFHVASRPWARGVLYSMTLRWERSKKRVGSTFEPLADARGRR